MEARSTTTLTALLPILNPWEYDLWLMWIEQYFLTTDYSLWEVIKNGNKVLKRTIGIVEHIYEPTSAEEKLDKKNEMKARGTLLMALLNKDRLKFHSYQDTKLLMEAIEKRYGGNEESKKVQRTLLNQLEIQGEVIEQEDMNLKLLRSLPSEWKSHALIWRNKVDKETISLDDLYNNIKIYEFELIGSSSTSQNPQNIAFVSSNSTNNTSNTNEANNTAFGVSTAHSQGNSVNSTSVDYLSDAVICAFLASQPNSPQLAREDLKQIDLDDIEEIDLHWEMAMLTIRARRYKAKEENPTNYALMALTSSGSSFSSDSEVDSCSRTCKKAYATPKEQYDSLSLDFKKSQFNLVSYKAGLQSVEERLAHYKKNEVVFEEKINILNLEVKLRDNVLVENIKKLEKAEKERDELKLTLEKFQNSSKSLNNLLENQENIKSRSDKGYYVVPPPYTENSIPPKPDLMFIDEQVENYDGGFVSFGDGKGRISSKGKIKTETLDFDDVYFCKELKYNLFSMSQMCDKKNNVLFTDTECLVLSFNFKLLDESQVLLRVPRKDNIYSVDLKNVVPTGGTKDNIVTDQAEKKKEPEQEYILIPICTSDPLLSQGHKDNAVDVGKKTKHINSTNSFNIVVSPVNTAGPSFSNTALPLHINAAGTPVSTNAFEEHPFEQFYPFKNAFSLPHVPIVTPINDTEIFGNAYDDETVEEKVDMNNVDSSYTIPDAPLTKFLKDHPKDQVIGSIETPVQTRQMTKINEEHGLQVQQKSDGIFISQEKYVADILKKFNFTTVKTTSILIEPNKALVKDAEAEDVDMHLYRSMIGSLMYLTTSRPDITFAVCACARFQVTLKTSHLHAVKRIFRYLRGHAKLGLWCPRDSLFDLEAYYDSDYARASLDRKFTIAGCQFLGKWLISWQCKKQTIVVHSTIEAEYVTAASYRGQVLWIQNQTLDYGFNLMSTKIYIDNESTICVVKNPVFHSKTKHIEIRHHFIRDSYEKKLI
uniref:Uncharacterized protein n=1 Tax=Tanacetum cinerariifolium TaxID=118510 RepID=A0A6L2JZ53_TANCI|nr:hypothetical protein [Tanacetum cinerariifolium]